MIRAKLSNHSRARLALDRQFDLLSSSMLKAASDFGLKTLG